MAVVLITGCSSGFGRAAALAFARGGHDVVATMRDPSRWADRDVPGPSLSVDRLDVTDPASRQDAVDGVIRRHGRLDILVNNAGISALGPAEEVPGEVARAMFETNFWGPYELIRTALPALRDSGTGRIVNVTSIGALLSSGFYSVYCATKHALDALSLGLDIELQQFGIRCVTVVPGGFNTSIATNRIAAAAEESRYPRSEHAIREYEERLTTRNDLTPVVTAILAAATDPSPRSRYLVGEGTTRLLEGVVEEGERIHEALRARDAV